MKAPKACALCKSNSAIRNSHGIPKFSIDWIKKTSATGRLRSITCPNLPIQDIEKHELLCRDCELRFSKFEGKFAERIFVPHQDAGQETFQYEEWLLQFAVSLAWRTAVIHLEDCRSRINPALVELADAAIDVWGDFLLGKSSDAGLYTHHLLFLGYITDAPGMTVPEETHRYFLRLADATIAAGEKYIFTYTKLPGMIFWSCINPQVVLGWNGTRILRNSVIGRPQMVNQPGWADFLVKRIQEVTGRLSQISDKQVQRIRQELEKNPEKALASKTFEAVRADDYWDQRQGRS